MLVTALSAAAVRAADKPVSLADIGIDQRLNELVPLDLTFQDESGRDVQLKDYFDGKPVILVLAYYRCPRLCNEVLNGLLYALKNLEFNAGEQFRVLVVSFDPTEKPDLAAAKKASYVENYNRPGAAGGWHFLTGPAAASRSLADAVGFRYAWDPLRRQYGHSSAVMLLTPAGRVSRYFFGINFAPRDLRLGLVEASDNKIGSKVDQALLLFCYSYDPVTGKYRVAVLNLVRLAGVVTVAVLATYLLVSWRRERRKNRKDLATAG
jgi:protein SCO1/2